MSFGYIGDTSTSVKQQVKNKGILTTQESFDLERQGFLGGTLELIQSQTFSSTQTIDFSSIQGAKYDVMVAQLIDVQTNGGNDNIDMNTNNFNIIHNLNHFFFKR